MIFGCQSMRDGLTRIPNWSRIASCLRLYSHRHIYPQRLMNTHHPMNIWTESYNELRDPQIVAPPCRFDRSTTDWWWGPLYCLLSGSLTNRPSRWTIDGMEMKSKRAIIHVENSVQFSFRLIVFAVCHGPDGTWSAQVFANIYFNSNQL